MTTTREDGFVLAAVLLALVALGALAAAGFVLTRTDYEVSLNHRTSVEAGDVAERGIATYLANKSQVAGDEIYVFGSDTARVEVTRLLEMDPTYEDTLYRLTSTGVRWVGDRRASRTLSRLAVDRAERMNLDFAVASGVSIEVKGNAEVIGQDDCTGVDGTAVAVPEGGYFQGDEANVQGSPKVDSSYASPSALLQATDVDWEAIVQDTLVEPDYYVPADAWPGSFGSHEYPVIRITDADMTLDGANSGQGTIIAEENLTLRGSFDWGGLILTGGGVDVAGGAVVRGTVVEGLNTLLGQSPSTSSVSSTGNAEVRHDSCEVESAVAQGFRWVADVPGSQSEVMDP
jgi:hypothetical protein